MSAIDDNVTISLELHEHTKDVHTNTEKKEPQTEWNNLSHIESYFEKHKLLFLIDFILRNINNYFA